MDGKIKDLVRNSVVATSNSFNGGIRIAVVKNTHHIYTNICFVNWWGETLALQGSAPNVDLI